MRIVAVAVCAFLVASMLPGGAAVPSLADRNRAFVVSLFEDMMADGSAGVDMETAGADAFVDATLATIGDVDLAAVFRTAESGGDEAGGWPAAGDIQLLEAAFRINNEIKCSAEPVHYDHAVETGNETTFPFVGTATSDFSDPGFSIGLAIVYSPGHWNGAPALAPPKGFLYDEKIVYGGNSDFTCYDYKYCAFGVCYYWVWNAPKVIGAAHGNCDLKCLP